MTTVQHAIRMRPKVKSTLPLTLKEEGKVYFDKFISQLLYMLFVGVILVEFGLALFIVLG